MNLPKEWEAIIGDVIVGCVGFTDVVLEAADALESQARRIAELEGLLMVERSWNERHRVRMMQIVELEAERDALKAKLESAQRLRDAIDEGNCNCCGKWGISPAIMQAVAAFDKETE